MFKSFEFWSLDIVQNFVFRVQYLAIDFTGGAVFSYNADFTDPNSVERLKEVFVEKGADIKQVTGALNDNYWLFSEEKQVV